MTKNVNKESSDKSNNPKPNRWSFLNGSQEVLERQKAAPNQEEEVNRLDQFDNLSESDPDIKESIRCLGSNRNRSDRLQNI